MRLLLVLVIAAFSAIGAAAAAGPVYPWCTTGAAQEFGARNCGFVNFEQCLQSARGNGQNCERNPALEPASSQAVGPVRKARRKPSR